MKWKGWEGGLRRIHNTAVEREKKKHSSFDVIHTEIHATSTTRLTRNERDETFLSVVSVSVFLSSYDCFFFPFILLSFCLCVSLFLFLCLSRLIGFDFHIIESTIKHAKDVTMR